MRREPCVAALSAELADTATRLAAAWGVRPAVCGPWEKPFGAQAILLLARDWTAVALRRVHAAMALDPTTVPGLLVARDRADAERQVNGWLATGHRAPAPLARVLDFRVAEPGALRAEGEGMLVAGRRIELALLRALLGAGADVVRIATHGDGLDSSLGEAGVLCAMAEAPSFAGRPKPPCIARRHCHRLDRPLDAALAGGALVAPQRIRARVIVLDTCSGLHVGNVTFDAMASLAMAFSDIDEPPTVITRAGLGLGNARSDESLIEDLRRGFSVSEAVARYNARPEALALDRCYLVVGNPRLRVAVAAPVRRVLAARPVQAGSPLNEAPRSAYCAPQRRFVWLATLASKGLSVHAAARLEPQQRHALRALANDLARATRTGGRYDTHERLGHTLLGLIPLLGRHALTDLWEEKAVIRINGRSDCAACGGEERRFFGRIPQGEDRVLAICQACGITEDRPAAARPMLTFDVTADGRLQLMAGGATAGSRALSIYGYDERPATVLPIDERALLRRLPRPETEGPVQIGLWHHRAGRLAVRYRRLYVRFAADDSTQWLRPGDDAWSDATADNGPTPGSLSASRRAAGQQRMKRGLRIVARR